jgi:hypothetical protein
MNQKQSDKKSKKPLSKSDEAAEAKAEELPTALESKGEQGKSSLGSLPPDEEKSS